MPNHVKNRLTFHAPKESHVNYLETLCKGDALDFEKLIPIPGVYLGATGLIHEKLFGEDRCFSGGCRDAWGTKWGPYSVAKPESNDDSLVLVFETAWNAPHPVIVEIAKRSGCRITHEWCCEGGCTWGRIEYSHDGTTETIACNVGEFSDHRSGKPTPTKLTHDEIGKLIWPSRFSNEDEDTDQQ